MFSGTVGVGVPFDKFTMRSIKTSRASTPRLSSENVKVRKFYSFSQKNHENLLFIVVPKYIDAFSVVDAEGKPGSGCIA